MSDPVAAIAEDTATGALAEIFEDIRQVLAVKVVNLVWRHLATIDGALPWAWSCLRPLYVDGSVGLKARALRRTLALPSAPSPTAAVFAGLGLDRDALRGIGDVLDAYDRTNAMALVALSALCSVLAGGVPAGVSARQRVAERPRAISLPPLPVLNELSRETAALVVALNGFGTRRSEPVLASMYRHLAYWPPYLAFAWLFLAPIDADGRLTAAIDEARSTAARHAAALLPAMGHPPSALSPGLASSIAAALEPFVGDVILKLVVICALLRRATPGGEATGGGLEGVNS
jgi:hypothetical protein